MLVNRSAMQRRRGANIIETAFVLLLCILFIMGVFEYGRFLMVKQMVDNAAREAVRVATIDTNSGNLAGIQSTAINYLVGQPLLNTSGKALSASDIQVYLANPATGNPATPSSTWTNAQFGNTLAVRITAVYKPMLPTFGFLPTSITLTSTVMMQCEAY
jgi:Flp pilus assembly protein TadG